MGSMGSTSAGPEQLFRIPWVAGEVGFTSLEQVFREQRRQLSRDGNAPSGGAHTSGGGANMGGGGNPKLMATHPGTGNLAWWWIRNSQKRCI